MKLRYGFLAGCLFLISLCFFASSRDFDVNIYSIAAMAITVVALSISALSLALYTLRTFSFVYITRNVALVTIIVVLLDRPKLLFSAAILLSAAFHLVLYSETILSRLTREISHAHEDMFILTSPRSVFLWFTFTWCVFWATCVEAIHLFGTSRNVLGVISCVFALAIGAVFIGPQLRILFRRVVIVPQGVVLSDPIALTDVVLFPLSKIVDITMGISQRENQDLFASSPSKKNLATIELNEHVDSLIARKGVGETERVNANAISLSVADVKNFVATFHRRFHKVEPQEMSRSQEIMAEKELGIETAPRSDAPLPQHRKKKSPGKPR